MRGGGLNRRFRPVSLRCHRGHCTCIHPVDMGADAFLKDLDAAVEIEQPDREDQGNQQ